MAKEFPDDILQEILVRLPVKTLCRFRLVCKAWLRLISHPQFQHDHYRRSQHNPLVLAVESNGGYHHLSTHSISREGLNLVSNFSVKDDFHHLSSSFIVDGSDYYTIQSCRGLVCFGPMSGLQTFLCNPSTQELLSLPPIEGSNSFVGLGYKDSTKEFKVVIFYYSRQQKIDCCKIFTLGTNHWREAKRPPFQTENTLNSWGAPFVQGSFHLLHHRYNHLPHQTYNHFSISAFSIENEDYSWISVPEDYNTDLIAAKISELGGSLCLVGKLDDSMELWFLKDYQSNDWVKEYVIDLPFMSRWHDLDVPPLAILADGSIWFTNSGVESYQLQCYDIEEGAITRLIDVLNCSRGLYFETFQSLQQNLQSNA